MNTSAVNGSACIDPTLWMNGIFQCHGFLCLHPYVEADAGAGLAASENFTLNLSGTTQPLDQIINFGCICFAIGPVPVAIFPKIEITLTLSGTITVTSSASLNVSGDVGWSTSQGFFSSGSGPTFTSNGGPIISANGSGSAVLAVTPQLCLYDVVCAGLQASAGLSATIDTNPTPPAPYFSLCPSLELSAYFSYDLIFWSGSTTRALLSYVPSGAPGCYVVPDPPPPPVVLSISPANPSVSYGANVEHFTASRSDAKAPNLTWALGAGSCCSDSINPTTGELSTYPLIVTWNFFETQITFAAPYCVAVQATDATTPVPQTNPATTQACMGTAWEFDPPTGFSESKVILGNFERVTVTWHAPTNSGGYGAQKGTVTGYTVTGPGLFGTVHAPGPSFTFTIPKFPELCYNSEVAAYNNFSQSSFAVFDQLCT